MSGRALRGWKAIGDHLHVTDTTLRRWRRKYAGVDPLPLLQPGGFNGPVFAYPEQLDAWLERRGELEVEPEPAPFDEVPRRGDRLVIVHRAPGA